MFGAKGSLPVLWPGLTRELSNRVSNSVTILLCFCSWGNALICFIIMTLPKYNLLNAYYMLNILGTRAVSVNKTEE